MHRWKNYFPNTFPQKNFLFKHFTLLGITNAQSNFFVYCRVAVF
jgi:hypothetical protein